MNKTLAICGATVIDTYNGNKSLCDILVEGERIAAIGSVGSLNIPANAESIDATGRYAIPGLWDAHVHITFTPDLKDRMPALCTAYGITSVRDMGGKLERLLAYRKKSLQKNSLMPRLWFAGPFINSTPLFIDDPNTMSVEVDNEQEASELVDALAEAGVHFIKPYESLLPEMFKAIAERAKHYDLKLAGHTSMNMTIAEILDVVPDFDIQHLGGHGGMKVDCACQGERLQRERAALLAAKRAGADSDAELVKLMHSVLDELPVSPADQDPEKRTAMIELFVEKGTWHTPTFTVMMSLANLNFENNPDRIEGMKYLPKAFVQESIDFMKGYEKVIEERHTWDAWYMETAGLLHKAGVPLLAGTDSPLFTMAPGQALHLELQAMVQAGLSPLAALQTATVNPAKFLEIEDDLGSIAEGKFADLLLLNKDPLDDISNTLAIDSVLTRGRHLNRQALDQMFADMTE